MKIDGMDAVGIMYSGYDRYLLGCSYYSGWGTKLLPPGGGRNKYLTIDIIKWAAWVGTAVGARYVWTQGRGGEGEIILLYNNA